MGREKTEENEKNMRKKRKNIQHAFVKKNDKIAHLTKFCGNKVKRINQKKENMIHRKANTNIAYEAIFFNLNLKLSVAYASVNKSMRNKFHILID